MSAGLDFIDESHRVVGGPNDVGSEQRWSVVLGDGRRAVVGQLAPDLARDEPIRRRYVRDVERVAALPAISLAPTLAMGPQPEPRDPNAGAPWRMRLDPDGEPLSTWLERAPVPIEEFTEVFTRVADAVHAVHVAGAVMRDLRPDQIIRTSDGRVVLADVGLARVDVLSSHTASSLLMQGSTYAAPEQLWKTAIDQRSDIYSLGAMMWEALTGELPFDDAAPLLAERDELPKLSQAREDVPLVIENLVAQCLQEAPEERPGSASEISWVLRGGVGPARAEESTTCQHCGGPLRVGQRLCLACGRLSVRFFHAEPAAGDDAYSLDLVSLSEDAEPLTWLQDFIVTVSHARMRKPEFVIGSVHMYSEEERAQRIRVPVRLYGNLTADTARVMNQLMQERGLKTRISSPSDSRKAGAMAIAAVVATVLGSVALYLLGTYWWLLAAPGGVATVAALMNLMNKTSERRTPGKFFLRPMPAALPASDPLVARLAALLDTSKDGAEPPADVREIVGELALLVQRLVDHRASFASNTRELDVLTAPVEPLVAAVEDQVRHLTELSAELRELDEGAMVRALAASEARGEPAQARENLLSGLDRLRALEDQRAEIFHRLLEAKALLHRTINMGLAVQDPAQEHERHVQLALATLGAE